MNTFLWLISHVIQDKIKTLMFTFHHVHRLKLDNNGNIDLHIFLNVCNIRNSFFFIMFVIVSCNTFQCGLFCETCHNVKKHDPTALILIFHIHNTFT